VISLRRRCTTSPADCSRCASSSRCRGAGARAANKRVGNILKKSDAAAAAVDPALLGEPAEQALAAALGDVGTRADQAYAEGEYARSLRLLAGLKPAVDAFFDNVMVNVDSAPLRANRLALLAALRATMNRVADLSRLAV
jgi:glycyl-tRNA synthetase beta chain